MQDMEVRLPHSLTADEVRRRIDGAVEMARGHYADTVGSIEATWSEEVLSVSFSTMGMPFEGTIENLPQELLVRLRLPAMASLFAGRIRQGLEERLGGLITS